MNNARNGGEGKKNAHDKSQSGSKSSKAEKRKSRLVLGDTPVEMNTNDSATDSSSDRSYDDSMSVTSSNNDAMVAASSKYEDLVVEPHVGHKKVLVTSCH